MEVIMKLFIRIAIFAAAALISFLLFDTMVTPGSVDLTKIGKPHTYKVVVKAEAPGSR
jgi:hypothetical protein